ncbi:hypothetical protein DFQ27_004687, partial [Actinomortierella ambigua]
MCAMNPSISAERRPFMPLSTTNFILDETTLTDGETETEGDTTESETEARSKRAPRASTPLTQLVTAMETTHVR